MLCILYVNVVGMCLGLIGLLTERVLPAAWSRRWLWCLVITTSMVIPPIYRARHASSVTAMFEREAEQPLFGHVIGAVSTAALDPRWWTRVESWGTIIEQVWLVASSALIVWGLASALRVAQLVWRARRDQRATGNPTVVDGVPVVITDGVGPATVGLLRSRVLVPRWVLALPSVQRRYVLRHEQEHARAHDALLLFVASLPLVLMPWNLALWWQLRRLCLAIEMDCDNRVVAELGDATAYGELLLRIAQATSRGPRLQPAFLGGMGSLERRLVGLLAPAPLRYVQRVLLPALALGLLLLVLSMPHPVR